MEPFDGLQMLLESTLHIEWQDGDSVLSTLALSDSNLLILYRTLFFY
jgi:hypothetical protein